MQPLPASGPAGEASSAYPAPSDTSSVSGVSRSSQTLLLRRFRLCLIFVWLCVVAWRLVRSPLAREQSGPGRVVAGPSLFWKAESKSPDRRDLATSKAQGYLCPLYVTSASAYRAIVGDFKSDTLSHGFGSQAEAKVYCAGAGVAFPSAPHQWTSQQ